MNIIKILFLAAILASIAFLSGCETNQVKAGPKPKPVVSCTTTFTNDLASSVYSAQLMLAKQKCRSHFSSTYKKLLTIGEGDPKISNQKIYGDFVRWAKKQGIITNIQMQQLYSRYFTTVFTSLPNEGNQMCYYCTSPKGEKKIMNAMSAELADKQRGLVRILNDKAKFKQASSIGSSVGTIIEAACHACRNGG